jgi:hypothetical protein
MGNRSRPSYDEGLSKYELNATIINNNKDYNN